MSTARTSRAEADLFFFVSEDTDGERRGAGTDLPRGAAIKKRVFDGSRLYVRLDSAGPPRRSPSACSEASGEKKRSALRRSPSPGELDVLVSSAAKEVMGVDAAERVFANRNSVHADGERRGRVAGLQVPSNAPYSRPFRHRPRIRRSPRGRSPVGMRRKVVPDISALGPIP